MPVSTQYKLQLPLYRIISAEQWSAIAAFSCLLLKLSADDVYSTMKYNFAHTITRKEKKKTQETKCITNTLIIIKKSIKEHVYTLKYKTKEYRWGVCVHVYVSEVLMQFFLQQLYNCLAAIFIFFSLCVVSEIYEHNMITHLTYVCM